MLLEVRFKEFAGIFLSLLHGFLEGNHLSVPFHTHIRGLHEGEHLYDLGFRHRRNTCLEELEYLCQKRLVTFVRTYCNSFLLSESRSAIDAGALLDGTERTQAAVVPDSRNHITHFTVHAADCFAAGSEDSIEGLYAMDAVETEIRMCRSRMVRAETVCTNDLSILSGSEFLGLGAETQGGRGPCLDPVPLRQFVDGYRQASRI